VTRLVMKGRVDAEELLRRFDANGGQVYHFRGRRRCYVSTIPIGRYRVRHSRTGFGQWLLPNLVDVVTECSTRREDARANRALLDRAKRLPAVTPTLVMLEQHLRAIRVDTIADRNDAWGEINGWCRIVEVCETPESAKAFGWRVLPELNEVFVRIYEARAVAVAEWVTVQ
jgi:hypothetical protein